MFGTTFEPGGRLPVIKFKARNVGAFLCPTGVNTPVPFTTVFYNSLGAGLYTLATPDRFFAPISGTYLIGAGATWLPAGGARRYLFLIVNGVPANFVAQNELTPAAGTFTSHSIAVEHYLNAGEFVQLLAFQDSGAPLGFFGGAGGNYQSFWARYTGS